MKLNRDISQPDRADGRRPSEQQRAVRPIGGHHPDQKPPGFWDLVHAFVRSRASLAPEFRKCCTAPLLGLILRNYKYCFL